MKKDISKTVANNIFKYRTGLNLTQQQVADKLGYTGKAFSKWERGVNLPSVETLAEIADLFDIGISALFECETEPEYYLGIDGGATKTTFALADKAGKIIRVEKLGPSNPFDLGFEKAALVIDNGIKSVSEGIPNRKISLFAGLSGGSVGNMRERIRAFLNGYGFARVANGSDSENIISAGLGNGDGIAVIMGTGISAWVRKNGTVTRVGGLGYLFDRGGSAYDLGADAIRAACMAEDGTGEKTLLTELIKKACGTETVIENLPQFYEKGKSGIASYSGTVFEAYAANDKVARDILNKNMESAAHLIDVCLKRFDGKTKVVLVGGLTRSGDIILPMLKDALKDNVKKCDIEIYTEDVVYGALLNAGMPANNER